MLDTILKNGKILFYILVVALAVWYYKDYEYQKAENKRQSENASQEWKADSLKYSFKILTQQEINEYLKYQNSNLLEKLKEFGINPGRIEKTVDSHYYYADTTSKKFTTGPFVDSTKCLTIKGIVSDNGSVVITDRKFENKTSAVAYWERREWSFLGIKTRFLGKKQMTAKVFDDCGNSQIINIEKK